MQGTRKRNISQVKAVEKQWLSSKEAQKYLDCSDDLLKKLRDEGQLTYSRYGGKAIWYEVTSINEFLERNRVESSVLPRNLLPSLARRRQTNSLQFT